MTLIPSPPRRWIKQTLGPLSPIRVGSLIRPTLRSLAVEESHDDPLVCEFDDHALAEIILDDAPHYRCGDNSINGRGHGGWALCALGREDEAWFLFHPLIRMAQKIRSREFRVEIPVGQLLLFLWLSLKRGATQEAYIAQRLVSMNRHKLNRTMQEDFRSMTEALLALERHTRPVLTLVGDC